MASPLSGPAPRLETARLTLRLIKKSDLPDLFAVNGDEDVIRYTPHPAWKTPADGKAWFKRVLKNRASGKAMQLVIVLKETGRVIGILVMFKFEEPTKQAEIGYSLAREYWGRGLASEAVNAFVDYAFKTLKLERLEGMLDPRNGASAKVLLKAGFKHEGHQRRNFHAKGETSDTGLYGLLRADPAPREEKSVKVFFKLLGVALAVYAVLAARKGEVYAKSGATGKTILKAETPGYFWAVIAVYGALSAALLTIF